MSVTLTSGTETEHLTAFLEAVWGEGTGYACIASRPHSSDTFQEMFFQLPDQREELQAYVQRLDTSDVWYCPQLFSVKQRRKDKVKFCRAIWSDLDTCQPEQLLRPPSMAILSSPGRWQALWLIGEPVDPYTLEAYSKRIAYYHAEHGADKSGWDLTQLLRMPYTYNFKYDETPKVRVIHVGPTYNELTALDVYPKFDEETQAITFDFPDVVPNDKDVIEKHKHKIHPAAYVLLNREPKDDWSKSLWQLETMLIESGLTTAEVFAIVEQAPCNKYERDGRGRISLWREVCRADAHVARKGLQPGEDFVLGPMLTDTERQQVIESPSIVRDYIEMASEMTDASPQYHQAGIFILLSALLAGSLVVETDYGEVQPNLWFLILADTTLTRKTTSMDIAMDILEELDDDAVLATDGSIEGMVSALADRNGRCSIFLRDEFSGLMEMMVKKDHYAGMLETFAKLYDGKAQKKILRRQTIDIKKPVFLIYAGGIKSRILELLSSHHIDSGFLPRFVLVSADADLGALRPLGPRRAVVREKRDRIIARLTKIKDTYSGTQIVKVAGIPVAVPAKASAELTPEAWKKFQYFEALMNHDASMSATPEYLTPTFVRLTMSGLKAAVLLAACRCAVTGQPLEVDEVDIVEAFYFVEQWRKTAYEIVSNIGRNSLEVQIERAVRLLSQGQGVASRASLMQRMKLTNRTAMELFDTMEQRGMIIKIKSARIETINLLEGTWLK